MYSWWVSGYRPGSEAIDLKPMLWSFQGEKTLKKPRTKDEPDISVGSSLTTCVDYFSHPSPEQNRLAECEEQAKAAKKGMWSEGSGSQTIRDLKYTIENPRHFVDSHHQKPVNGEALGKRQVDSGRFLSIYSLINPFSSGTRGTWLRLRQHHGILEGSLNPVHIGCLRGIVQRSVLCCYKVVKRLVFLHVGDLTIFSKRWLPPIPSPSLKVEMYILYMSKSTHSCFYSSWSYFEILLT